MSTLRINLIDWLNYVGITASYIHRNYFSHSKIFGQFATQMWECVLYTLFLIILIISSFYYNNLNCTNFCVSFNYISLYSFSLKRGYIISTKMKILVMYMNGLTLENWVFCILKKTCMPMNVHPVDNNHKLLVGAIDSNYFLITNSL